MMMSDLMACKLRKDYGHTWHWMSLLKPGIIKQYKLKIKLIVFLFHFHIHNLLLLSIFVIQVLQAHVQPVTTVHNKLTTR